MSSEPSLWRFATFNFLLYCFLLWLLSSQMIKFQIVADQLLHEDDVSALIVIAEELELTVPSAIDDGFCNKSTYPYDVGIYCNCSFENHTLCHINEISLINKDLTGKIPEELANLTYLQRLDLSDNKLQGSIPAKLGKLQFLYEIYLSNNQLTGEIPYTLGKLIPQIRNSSESAQGALEGGTYKVSRPVKVPQGGNIIIKDGQLIGGGMRGSDLCAMFTLDLSSNQLDGKIPESLGNITMNESLGKFDPGCSDFSISLSYNRLSGDIPESLGKLKLLTSLDLGENNLSGTLPETLGNLRSLSSLYLNSNNFTGPLPKSYGQLSDLVSFSISGNFLSGPFPDFITNWTSINTLSLYGNNFQGRIPPEIFNLEGLNDLMISDVWNSSFQFPQISMPFYITNLVMRNCSINGEIPEYLFNVSSLEYLDLSFNNLTGVIPNSLNLTKLKSLKYMSLANNTLKGTLPAWIGVANWITIDLSYNSFSNSSPELQTRKDLNLFLCCDRIVPNMTTNLNQTIKERCPRRKHLKDSLFINCGGEDWDTDEYHHYDSDNETSQAFISPKGNWAYSNSGGFLSSFLNSSEYIKREKCAIPVNDAPLYEKARLSPASLRYSGFCLRKGRYNVTLHFVEIVFAEDEDYSSSMKRIFNVDIQHDRVLTDFNIKDSAGGPKKIITKSFMANVTGDGLLEIHLYWAGKGSSTPFNGPLISAITITHEIKPKKLSRVQILLITLASIVFTALLLLALAWAMGWFGKEELHEINVGQEKPVTLKQLKDATGKFSNEMEIGKGSSGTVYKAQLTPEYNVAVKRVFINSIEGINKTKSEFYNSLQNLAHENLVRLFDVYVGKGVYLLIYEYMENRSLQDVLFGELKSKITLDWEARYNICLGIARGLKYLHEEHPRGPGFKMVHRGIKPTNILLDGALKAKISDFGNSVLYAEDYQENQFDRVTKEEASSGYVAPEYLMYGAISYKYDVYGYGVVILEIVCGRRNAEQKLNKDELEYLVDEVVVANSQGRLREMVDKNLLRYDEKEAMTILKLAVKCINISTSFRPTMSEVVSVLIGEKTIDDIWKPDSTQNLCQNCLKSLREDDGVVEHPRA